ncbi:MAG: molybdenum cofactor biosynthesis protein MoaE [Planctomycetota bacterium]
MDTIELIDREIDIPAYLSLVAAPDCGAVLSFLGNVRNEHHGRAVRHLEYSAYAPMAQAKMAQIASELVSRWPIRNVAIVHRLGRLEVGETSILIALALPHRREGFDALRYAIDTFKQVVPIWKKEHFADGTAAWVQGS